MGRAAQMASALAMPACAAHIGVNNSADLGIGLVVQQFTLCNLNPSSYLHAVMFGKVGCEDVNVQLSQCSIA